MPWGTRSRTGIEAGGYLQSPGTATCVLGTARSQDHPPTLPPSGARLLTRKHRLGRGRPRPHRAWQIPKRRQEQDPGPLPIFATPWLRDLGPATQPLRASVFLSVKWASDGTSLTGSL